jgi:hypothetical protein
VVSHRKQETSGGYNVREFRIGSYCLTAVALVGFALYAITPALAAEFFPIVSIESSTAGDDLFPASNLIQGPGVGFDANAPYDALLSGADGTWVTAAPGGYPSDYIEVAGMPVLSLDLGQDTELREVSIWGYSDTNANGASEVSLLFATDAEGPDGVGSSIAYNPTFFPAVDAIPRQSFLFSEAVDARYVQLTVVDTYYVAPGDGTGGPPGLAGGDRAGLGEIAFANVPEPSTIALVGLALACLIGCGWRKS